MNDLTPSSNFESSEKQCKRDDSWELKDSHRISENVSFYIKLMNLMEAVRPFPLHPYCSRLCSTKNTASSFQRNMVNAASSLSFAECGKLALFCRSIWESCTNQNSSFSSWLWSKQVYPRGTRVFLKRVLLVCWEEQDIMSG